jgi:hypothetical protein
MSKTARLNFLYVGSDSAGNKRCQDLATEFKYSYLQIENAEKALELEGNIEQVQFIVLNSAHESQKEGMAAQLQTIRYVFKESFILVVGEKRIPAEAVEFVKKSGANMVFLENEFIETSRLEFVSSQIIRASYIPVKPSEFPKDAVLDFTLYHLMPLNQKLLPVLPKGSPLNESRLKKLEGVGEVYIKREEVDKYRAFVEAHPDPSGGGLKKRCRAQYLNFCSSHSQLMFLLIDQSSGSSFKEGKWLYDRCEVLARDLLTTLSAVGEAWDVVNNSSIGEFGSVERCPTIAAYVGLMSLLSSVGDPVDIMVAALLSDVGLLDLHPKISKKLREMGDWKSLTGDDLEAFKKHPLVSLNRCLDRKLQMKDLIRDIILCTHERIDGKGFPAGKPSEKIPPESQLIQYVEIVDRAGMIKMGQAREDIGQIRKRVLTELVQEGRTISITLLQALRPLV